ncbi:F0F1 ATP synthase subunit delta [Ramlibacter sp. H39-3-26]|uniref:F0F1 ATP synthase subunit delta n=1 Tax=Curvibacter soli TaxID=3031331 RepID=UPI0023DC3A4B|nr:F0F1 ATP synthase subunit delta [Ramlibacter sp. H39-3-26]MDF1484565.1 F0F1 ATP synthase subunit delta [Ramlibacter sp. H39-3-26]
MAELATIARPYAEALFEAGAQDAAFDLGATAWLDELAAVAANPQLRQFAEDPRITPEQVFDLMAGVVKSPLPEAGRNFLRTVIDNDRLAAVPEIAAQFHALVNQRNGASDATVYSAFPIDASALADLSATLEKRFGRRLTLAVVQDASLIGGIRVVVGDEVLDTSVKARLEQMKAALTA